MTPPKQAIKKWCNELRSGKWKQGIGELQAGDRFCCFGVACKVSIPKGMQILSGRELNGLVAQDQPHAPSWLKKVNTDFYEQTTSSLLGLNDGVVVDGHNSWARFTFDEIADLLEAVYLLKVLK